MINETKTLYSLSFDSPDYYFNRAECRVFCSKEKVPDSEANPNRSTYNFGATGTRAFYELLAETGRRPTRWLEPVSALLSDSKNKPSTFIVVGKTRASSPTKKLNTSAQVPSAEDCLLLTASRRKN
jgi:hypothetical protein